MAEQKLISRYSELLSLFSTGCTHTHTHTRRPSPHHSLRLLYVFIWEKTIHQTKVSVPPPSPHQAHTQTDTHTHTQRKEQDEIPANNMLNIQTYRRLKCWLAVFFTDVSCFRCCWCPYRLERMQLSVLSLCIASVLISLSPQVDAVDRGHFLHRGLCSQIAIKRFLTSVSRACQMTFGNFMARLPQRCTWANCVGS